EAELAEMRGAVALEREAVQGQLEAIERHQSRLGGELRELEAQRTAWEGERGSLEERLRQKEQELSFRAYELEQERAQELAEAEGKLRELHVREEKLFEAER